MFWVHYQDSFREPLLLERNVAEQIRSLGDGMLFIVVSMKMPARSTVQLLVLTAVDNLCIEVGFENEDVFNRYHPPDNLQCQTHPAPQTYHCNNQSPAVLMLASAFLTTALFGTLPPAEIK